jgi:lysophospholipase
MVSLTSVLLLIHCALAYSPSGGYAPANVSCPDSANFVREASGISDDEKEWLDKRHKFTDAALLEFFNRADLNGFDAEGFMNSLNRSLTVGLAFSGGGYRAMLNGAGQISALDNRTTGAETHGLAGLLQGSTYLAGLSGGNWLTGTLALNNWTSVQDILASGNIWDLEDSIINSGGWNIFSTASRWDQIGDAVDSKEEAGFNTSLTDIWGRALSYQFFADSSHGGAALTFSGMQEFDAFKGAEMPMPISIAVGRAPTSRIISLNSTVFEFNPFEMGSWDPSLNAFTNLTYLGSDVSNGQPTSDVCVMGFDNAGFVMGTSSSLFNQFLLQLNTTGITGGVYTLIHRFLSNLDEDYDDVALYHPNPFYATNYASLQTIVQDPFLYLVDGGEDNQNVPFAPMLQPARDVDVIFAFDNSADTDDNFPNGTSLLATYERQFDNQGNGTSFPYVPTPDTIIKNQLNIKPMFLGCNSSNLTSLATIPPLIVYLPNIAYTTWSNTSTFKLSYSDEERNDIIQNGFESASRYNLTIDENWPKCVVCAIIRREQERNNITQSAECQECFQEYCWNGEQYEGEAEPFSVNYTSTNNVASPDSSSGVFSISSAASSNSRSSTNTASASSTSSSRNVAAHWTPTMSTGFIALMIAPMAGFLF